MSLVYWLIAVVLVWIVVSVIYYHYLKGWLMCLEEGLEDQFDRTEDLKNEIFSIKYMDKKARK